MFRFIGRKAAAVAFALAAAAPLGASAVPIELALVLDASGSINSTEWNLQRNAYANAVQAVLPTDGTVAVSVIRFATTATVVRDLTVIDSATELDALSSFFAALSQTGNGNSTCISCGIFEATGTFTGTADRSIVDVSTDGVWNTGVDPAGPAGTVGTAAWAVANAADVVNAIGIGVTPDFAAGPGAFNMFADDFAAFQAALTAKLRREVVGVPAPGVLALLGIGLFAIGAMQRRRSH